MQSANIPRCWRLGHERASLMRPNIVAEGWEFPNGVVYGFGQRLRMRMRGQDVPRDSSSMSVRRRGKPSSRWTASSEDIWRSGAMMWKSWWYNSL